MSDAMTNREIEDVLTSIRRLVAQDGGRAAPAEGPAPLVPRPAAKLILTEAHRIDAPSAEPAAPSFDLASIPSPDFGKLEATIAELEAAVSASGGTWEGEAPETPPRASNVTDLYGRLTQPPRRDDEEAELAALATDPAEPADLLQAAPGTAPETTPAPAPDDAAAVLELPPAEPAPRPADDTTDTGEAILDEAALYALVAQIVREELHGQLGERITAQVRKLVRAEIAKALDDRKFL